MIAQAAGPHPLSVDAALPFHPFLGCFLQGVVDIAGNLPVSQIIGTQNHPARHEVQGGADHIIGILHPYDIRVGVVHFDDGCRSVHKNPSD